jgi:hypothetical protein
MQRFGSAILVLIAFPGWNLLDDGANHVPGFHKTATESSADSNWRSGQQVKGEGEVIVSGEYRRRAYAGVDIDVLLDEYRSRSSGLGVLTRGENPVLFGRAGSPAEIMPAFDVATRDTAGAGDAFRGGLIYGLLQGFSDSDSVRYAAAVAALVCERFPGVMDSPTPRDVEFLLDVPRQQ